MPFVTLSQVQNLALGLVECHEGCRHSSLKPAQVPLAGIPFFQSFHHTTQSGIISKLAQGALNVILFYQQMSNSFSSYAST